MKKFIYGLIVIVITLGFTGCANTKPYPQTLKSWKSYKDVATYMQNNFRFDTSRQAEFAKDLKIYKRNNSGDMYDFTASTLSLKPIETYNRGGGMCSDAETLIKDALNKINPDYNAKTIFISNAEGPPHHWVTGFYVDGKLHVMDYGAGSHWREMMGTHGPYNSLNDYGNFLESINAQGFKLDFVRWRN
jgi:hypothetical protein